MVYQTFLTVRNGVEHYKLALKQLALGLFLCQILGVEAK